MDTMSDNKVNSEKNRSYFSRRFRQNIWENRKFFTGLCVLDILGLLTVTILCQLFCYTVKKNQESGYAYGAFHDETDGVIAIGLLLSFPLLAAVFTAGLPAALRSFSYLSRKNRTDMVFSLPVSTSSRFAADCLAGLFTYIVPFIIAAVISLLSLLVGYFFTGNGIGEISAQILFNYNASENILIEAVVFFMAVMIQFYVLSVFVTVCCGSESSTVIYSVVLNIVVPLLVTVSSLAVYGSSADVEYDTEVFSLLAATSPAGGLIVLNQILNAEIYTDIPLIPWFIRMSAVIIILTGLSFMLYRKRKAEDTSKAVVFPALFYILLFSLVSVFSGIGFSTDGLGNILNVLPIGAVTICVFVAFYIRRKKNKIMVLMKTSLCIALSFWVSSAFFIAGQKTGGFGAAKRVPDASSVKSVTVSVDSGILNPVVSECMIRLEDTESFEAVCSLHKEIIDGSKNEEGINYCFKLRYVLKNGDIVERIFDRRGSEQMRRLLIQLFGTEEYRKKLSEGVYAFFTDRQHLILENEYLVIGFSDINDCERTRYNCPDTSEIRAAESDIKAGFAQDIMECKGEWYIESPPDMMRINSVPVPLSFEKTRAEIEKYKEVLEKYNVKK